MPTIDPWEAVLAEQRDKLRLMSSWASQVRLERVRDLIRQAEYELDKEIDRRRAAKPDGVVN